jgi:hypothetical protein
MAASTHRSHDTSVRPSQHRHRLGALAVIPQRHILLDRFVPQESSRGNVDVVGILAIGSLRSVCSRASVFSP